MWTEYRELFNLAYEALLQLLTRFFTHTDETDPQLEALLGSAFALMTGVLRPLGSSLTEMPVGEQHPGRTTGPCFEMYYPMGNFLPWRCNACSPRSVRTCGRWLTSPSSRPARASCTWPPFATCARDRSHGEIARSPGA
jgi:hypothetical protein